MKQILLILAAFPFLVANAQEAKKETRVNQVSIGFVFSPDYCSRTLSNNGSSSSADLIINSRNKMETAKFGYTTGISLSVRFTKLLRFETGIQYSNKGYQTKKYDLVFQQPDPVLPVRAKFIYNYRYIDVPFKINFILGENRMRFITGAGFTANFLLRQDQRSILEYSGGNTEKRKESNLFDFKKFNLSPMISFGLEYKMSNNSYLAIEPTFRYGVLKTIDQPVTEYLWNAGLNIGFHYILK